jgi:hypothetical protein
VSFSKRKGEITKTNLESPRITGKKNYGRASVGCEKIRYHLKEPKKAPLFLQ